MKIMIITSAHMKSPYFWTGSIFSDEIADAVIAGNPDRAHGCDIEAMIAAADEINTTNDVYTASIIDA
jgi:hypothetical protein